MSARLEIKRSIAPSNLWHWIIIIDNKQEWYASKKSFDSAEECIKDAGKNTTIDCLVAADKL